MAKVILVECRGPETLVLAHGSHPQKDSHGTDSITLRPLHPVVASFPPNVYSKLPSLRLTTSLGLSKTTKLATWDRNNRDWVVMDNFSKLHPNCSTRLHKFQAKLFVLTKHKPHPFPETCQHGPYQLPEHVILSQPSRFSIPSLCAPQPNLRCRRPTDSPLFLKTSHSTLPFNLPQFHVFWSDRPFSWSHPLR